jgi:transposase
VFPDFLLPDPTRLEGLAYTIDEPEQQMRLTVCSIQDESVCPLCQHKSERVHSHYHRTLADLPCANLQVTLDVQVRRFFCSNPACPRRIFTERLPDIVVPWARRTKRLADAQTQMGLLTGGSVGEQLSLTLRIPSGDDVLVRLVRRTGPPATPTPRVLGVDDWAIRKGHTYGTVLVDLETQQVVDLLPDRESETLAAWLKDHPGVEIISRDRAGAYAEGATKGAPQAQQVADRWHLLKNLGEALLKVLEGHARALKQLSKTDPQPKIPPSVTVLPPSPPTTTSQKTEGQQPRARRYARYEEVHRLLRQGMSLKAIAAQMGLDRKTVRKYIAAETFPERQPRIRFSILNPYKAYLIQRWQEGGCNVRQLFREIQQQGYPGGLGVVSQFMAELRRQNGLPPYTRMFTDKGQPLSLPPDPLTPRKATWLVLSRPETLQAEDLQLIDRMRAVHSEVELAIDLAQSFATLVRQHREEPFDPWLERAKASPLPSFRSFAAGIRHDYAAVRAALSLPWSNGQVEGQVNRLKFLKRQMYGRAKFDLLRIRVLLVP